MNQIQMYLGFDAHFPLDFPMTSITYLDMMKHPCFLTKRILHYHLLVYCLLSLESLHASAFSSVSSCFGVFGIINLFSGSYIIAIDRVSETLSFLDKRVCRIQSIMLLPCGDPSGLPRNIVNTHNFF